MVCHYYPQPFLANVEQGAGEIQPLSRVQQQEETFLLREGKAEVWLIVYVHNVISEHLFNVNQQALSECHIRSGRLWS